MRKFLSDYITSLTTRRQERITDILEEAKVGKEQLDIIAQKLTSFGDLLPLLIADEEPEFPILAGDMHQKLRDALNRVESLYTLSSLISLLLDSHASVLGSDIKAIEDDLIALDKMSKNYGFLLSDGGAFNYAYLEPFTDERGRDSFDWPVPDRISKSFSLAEEAAVQTGEGVLALPQELTLGHGLRGAIVDGNVLAFQVLNTGMQNAVDPQSGKGWRMGFSCPTPVTTSLPQANGRTGAQVLAEFSLDRPAPASQIKLVPLADQASEVLQVQLFVGDNDQPQNLLVDRVLLDRPFTIHFPVQSVARFRVLLNQPTYSRISQFLGVLEQLYQDLHQEVRNRRVMPRGTDKSVYTAYQERWAGVQRYIRLYQQRRESGSLPGWGLPVSEYDLDWGVMSLPDLVQVINKRESVTWNTNDVVEKEMIRIFQKRFPPQWQLFGNHYEGTQGERTNTSMPASLIDNPAPSVVTSTTNYQYDLGLKFVAIGADSPGFRGYFVSKILSSPGDIGEVRLKTDHTNYRVPNTDRALDLVTSVEYSVSNESDPRNEDDWAPILPIGSTFIEGERFFLDETGKGYFRFPAKLVDPILLYRNGYLVDTITYTSLYDQTKQTVVGLNITNADFSSYDILMVSYTPAADYTTVNFETAGFSTKLPLVTAHDDNGAGLGFLSTGERNTIDLSHTPYVDRTQVQTSTYSSIDGMFPYQPITIRFDDGTIPTNLTNYRDGAQEALPATASKYYYIHSGSTIMFNNAVAQPFRVYYQYLQNNVRVRVVLRVNDQNFVSPKVDYFHLKAKTRLANPAQI